MCVFVLCSAERRKERREERVDEVMCAWGHEFCMEIQEIIKRWQWKSTLFHFGVVGPRKERGKEKDWALYA